MRTLTDREKRTIRYAATGIAMYLALFAGIKIWKLCEQQRASYRRVVQEAQDLKAEVKRYENKIAVVKKLMESFQMDPAKLKKATVVAEASAALQTAAMSSGIQVGPLRESPARPSSRELASIQFEGSGPVPATIALLHRVTTLGYPLIIDSAQITQDPTRPGQVKLNLTIVVLDFEQWKGKAETIPHA
jgi:hypothetical protein